MPDNINVLMDYFKSLVQLEAAKIKLMHRNTDCNCSICTDKIIIEVDVKRNDVDG